MSTPTEEVQGSVETVPKDMRQLRACLVCSLIKTFDQVKNNSYNILKTTTLYGIQDF